MYCHFYNYNDRNLVTIGASQLKVYRLITEPVTDEPKVSDSETTIATDSTKNEPKVRLECVQSFTLFANIESISKVSFAASKRDSLILGFDSAKVSIVEYDPNTHDLKTTSLHYFEEPEMRAGFTQFCRVPIVRSDPESRCAAVLIYSRNIVILPFRKDITSEDQEPTSTGIVSTPPVASAAQFNIKSPVMASYKLDLNSEQYGEKVNNIIDIQFLHNYYEPTLLILYEPVRTWAGRVAVRQDTCAMLVLSLDVHQRVHPHIWSVNHLPYDCFQAMPIPKPIGGVLIFANNCLIHLNQGLPPFGVSLNGFTEGNTSFLLRNQDDIKLSLDCSKACFISNDKLVISLRSGELYLLTLFNDMTRSIRGFNFDRCAASVLATSITHCENGYIFLGSRLGHSILLHYEEKPFEEIQAKVKPESDSEQISDHNETNDKITSEVSETTETKEKADESDESEEPSAKKIKVEDENEVEVDREKDNIGHWFAGDVALIEDDNLLEVYGQPEEKVTKKETLKTLVFDVCDSVINIGPCGRVCMGEPAILAEEFASSTEPDIELVTTSGYAKNGAP